MLENWFRRHQNRCSLILHAVGIPLTLLTIPALILAIARSENWLYGLAAAVLIIGYALQFIGHAVEGNDAGEVILIKKLLGRPYVAVVEDFREEKNDGRSR
jgi:hypothetical protein